MVLLVRSDEEVEPPDCILNGELGDGDVLLRCVHFRSTHAPVSQVSIIVINSHVRGQNELYALLVAEAVISVNRELPVIVIICVHVK